MTNFGEKRFSIEVCMNIEEVKERICKEHPNCNGCPYLIYCGEDENGMTISRCDVNVD